MSSDASAKAPPRSEMVNVVAWVQIIGAGFWALVSLTLMGLAVALSWATRMAAQAGHPPYNPWPLFGVAAGCLAAALLLLGAGTGLRRRQDWARRLTGVLCYVGAGLVVALFCLSYAGLDALLDKLTAVAQSSGGESGPLDMVGLVFKTFLGSLSAAAVALHLWVAYRLGRPVVAREFLPSRGEGRTVQS